MRFFGLLAAIIVAAAALAQSDPLFLEVPTDVTVLVTKHPTGADLVDITMRDPDYPPSVLRDQVAKMCAGFGTPPRGLVVGKMGIEGIDPSFQFVKATFATDGIILKDGGLAIQPVLRAFDGVPPPYTIKGLTIDFVGIAPTSKTVQRYGIPGVLQAEARYTATAPLAGIEYRVALQTQNPAQILFPDRYGEPVEVRHSSEVPSQGGRPYPILLLFMASGLAVAALVYFSLLRFGSKHRFLRQ